MDDVELQAIREARLRELQGAHGPKASSGFGSLSGAGLPAGFSASQLTGGAGVSEEEREQRRQQEEVKRTMLASVLEPEARERLARIALVKPARAEQIENTLIRLAQNRQLRGKVSEQELLDLLERSNGTSADQEAQGGKITFSRRKDVEDDDIFDL